MFDKHARGVLLFSAGKDSLATLLFLREFWDRITVVWSNPGAPHSETVEYMEGIRRRVPHFVEVRGSQPEWIKRHGWPVDVLPVMASDEGEIAAGPQEVKFQSVMRCCSANLWDPMRAYLDEYKPTLVIKGQRREESLRNRMLDAEVSVVNGVTFWHPLHDWTTQQVLRYITEQGELLPPFYALGAESSADCWNCTAYLDHNRTRLRWLRETHPVMFNTMKPALDALHDHLTAQAIEIAGITDD